MNQVTRQVTVKELHDILQAKSKKPVSYEDFLYRLMSGFLAAPALEFRYHDEDTKQVCVLKHQEIVKALESKADPQVPSESRAGKGE